MRCRSRRRNGQILRAVHRPSPLQLDDEASVKQGKLSDAGAQCSQGARDIGVGRSEGRDGVCALLIGEYVPYSQDSAGHQTLRGDPGDQPRGDRAGAGAARNQALHPQQYHDESGDRAGAYRPKPSARFPLPPPTKR